MKRWKEEGGKGYIFRVEMFFFIVEKLGRGRGNLGFQNHYGTRERVQVDFFSSFFYC
jgi:hypothetical protein